MGQMARYTALKKEVQTDVDVYNSLYAKIKEAGIAAASKSSNIRIVDPALTQNPEPSPLVPEHRRGAARQPRRRGAGLRARRTGQQAALS